MQTALLILRGLALLALGGEAVVRGAVGLARTFYVSERLIGLTLVAFAAATPELLTSVNATLAGSPGIAIGNVVGGSIDNILILAIVVRVTPVAVDLKAISRDGAIMVGVRIVRVALARMFGELSRLIGVALLLSLIGYVVFADLAERKGGPAAELHIAEGKSHDPVPSPIWQSLALAFGGLGLLVVGADWLVNGATTLERTLGVSETVIGRTIVAIGTSLPKLVASRVAAQSGRSDIAFGSLVGSNIDNIGAILRIIAIVAPAPIPPDMVMRDWIAMVGAALLLLMFAFTGRKVTRLEGVVLTAEDGVSCWLLLSAAPAA